MMEEFDSLDVVRAGLPKVHEEIARLARLPELEYQKQRRDAAKRHGLTVTFLDKEVARNRKPHQGTEAVAGGDVVETLEPWADPVVGADIAEEVRERLRTHVVFANATDPDALTLWIFGTFAMDVWRLFPKVLIESPTKRCGKTTLLECIEAFAFRGMMTSNTSAAALFRSIEKWSPTILIDEADRFLRDKDEIHGIVNAGHTRRGAYVTRCVEINGEQDVRRFSVWGPQVFAGIGKQADTLTDRSIVIALRRKLASDTAEQPPHDLHERMTRVRRQIARWADDNKVGLGALTCRPPDCGNDRRRDNWSPLWRIAKALGEPWPSRAAAAYAAQAAGEDENDDPPGVMMLRDVAAIFAERRASRLQSADLLPALVALEERPWAEWRRGHPITAQSISKMLRPFDVQPRNWKNAGSVLKAYYLEDLEAAVSRYSSEPSVKKPLPRYRNEIIEENPLPASATYPLPVAGSGYRSEGSGSAVAGKTTQYQSGSGVAANSRGYTEIEEVRQDFDAQDDPRNPEAWA